MNIGKLEWLNEHTLTDYPLTKYVGSHDFFLDANFIQFDGFVPVLKSYTIGTDSMSFVLTVDSGEFTFSLNKVSYIPETALNLRDGTRYLGCIVFGSGIYNLFDEEVGSTVTLNAPFCSSTVSSVNSNAGEDSINGQYGDLNVVTDENLFFSINGNDVTWNAVSLPDLPVGVVPLKTLNHVAPSGNAILLKSSELFKITPSGNSLIFSLAADNATINVI